MELERSLFRYPIQQEREQAIACMDNTLKERITIDPNICHGKACIRGLRYPVEFILELLAPCFVIAPRRAGLYSLSVGSEVIGKTRPYTCYETINKICSPLK